MEVKGRGLMINLRGEEDGLRRLLGLRLAGDPRAADLLIFRGRLELLFGFVLVLQLQQHW